ncbi:hypothetical protein M405DRAFT_488084 [Rhizopogon salebrosus TDB-379]|nr:hypothetical protein M405DRAFT_488084 [Rhizopogon salebrosus TDB-379]
MRIIKCMTRNTCIEDDESETYGSPALASDPLHGMFHSHAKLTVRPLPSLSISLLGARSIPIVSPQFIISQLPGDPPWAPTLSGTPRDMRPFALAWALGDYGRRWFWVGSSFTSANRSVVAFTSPCDANNAIEGDQFWSNDSLQVNEDSMLIDDQVVHNMRSYDS